MSYSQSKQHDFKVGDIVIKTYGKLPLEVTATYGQRLRCKYLHNSATTESHYTRLKIYEGEIEQGNMKMNQKLYQVKGKQEFGTALAHNSEGKIVLEMKGSGILQAYDPSEVEVVMPYTFSIRFNNGNEAHYRGKAGVLKKGDLVLETSNKAFSVGVVSGVDTKNERAKSKFTGVKLVTEEIEA